MKPRWKSNKTKSNKMATTARKIHIPITCVPPPPPYIGIIKIVHSFRIYEIERQSTRFALFVWNENISSIRITKAISHFLWFLVHLLCGSERGAKCCRPVILAVRVCCKRFGKRYWHDMHCVLEPSGGSLMSANCFVSFASWYMWNVYSMWHILYVYTTHTFQMLTILACRQADYTYYG